MAAEKMTVNELMAVYAEIFGVGADELTLDTHKSEVRDWDSMGVLMLMAEYDARLGLTLTAEQLEKLETIRDLVMIVKDAGKLEDAELAQ